MGEHHDVTQRENRIGPNLSGLRQDTWLGGCRHGPILVLLEYPSVSTRDRRLDGVCMDREGSAGTTSGLHTGGDETLPGLTARTPHSTFWTSAPFLGGDPPGVCQGNGLCAPDDHSPPTTGRAVRTSVRITSRRPPGAFPARRALLASRQALAPASPAARSA
ncbi:hypothetical protein A33M_0491 [Rhodovulum sp. PH10]|nr:hypothetical protein A33M_0491 [Rhodovulum sp. PH10]